MKNKLHFWYSQKQQEKVKRKTLAKLEDGRLAQYTEATETKNPLSQWEDLKYLGMGEIYSVNKIIQEEFRKD